MSDTRTAPFALWTIAQTFLNTLYQLFGGPERIAFQHTHTGQQRALVLPWLRAGEALMRRLLLLEAASYPKPNTRPLLTPARKRAKRMVGFDDDKPETWRVRFRCFTALNSSPASRSLRERANESLGGSGSRQSRETKGGVERKPQDHPAPIGDMTFHQGPWFTAKPAKFYSAWPLAERYEALIRVFNNPAPFAKRLAARLHALPHRAVELMRLPARQAGQRDTPDLVRDFGALESACLPSFRAFNSS